ncbi:winged helix-turn-helix domain-containing protein [Psychrobacillus sp. FSL K6-2684]|uniref:winged helix-turn-helix domain-containing protein n=1 Tax=Psychrobacillus sp. FSL K6-2684 TaxID=2921547 RepID=UPI0030FB2FDC
MELESLIRQEKGRNELKVRLLENQNDWQSLEVRDELWFEQGIKLYERLIQLDSYNLAYYTNQLVHLYLESAINEKIYHGNILRADRLLKKVIDLDPEHAQIYYRLAFINEHFKKWEAVLFYANEALDYGISEEEEVKLSSLMAYAYRKLGLVKRSRDQFKYAKELDKEKVWYLFIEHYEELGKKTLKSNSKGLQTGQDNIERLLQRKRENLCYILSFYSNRNMLIADDSEIPLTLKEAELLAFLTKQEGKLISSARILEHIWPELAINNPTSSVVKKTIRGLRKKFTDYNLELVIDTESPGYQLSSSIKIEIVQGVNFDRLSCR